jgi:hypothetical protein
MTEDGLRFVASFGGMLSMVSKQVERGGPHVARWSTAAIQASMALDSGDEANGVRAVAMFSEAARLEGWSVRSS